MIEELKIAALLSAGILLITLGVNLCVEGQYEVGVVLIVIGLAVLLVYIVLEGNYFKRMVLDGQ